MTIKRLLVANRGEIAIRVFRAATELGIRRSPFMPRKTSSRCIVSRPMKPIRSARARGRGALSYLSIDEVIRVAQEARSTPSIRAMASCRRALNSPRPAPRPASSSSARRRRRCALSATRWRRAIWRSPPASRSCRRPAPLPGRSDEIKRLRREVGYPVMLKASWGGGGRGMRPIESEDELLDAVRRAPGARPKPPSARTRSISKSWCATPAMSRCRFSAIRTAISCIFSSATARSSGATRRWSSARPAPYLDDAARAALCEAALTHRPRDQLSSTPARSNS